MNISKKFEPLISGLSAGIVITVLAFLTLEYSVGVWLLFSFGSSTLILFVFYKSEFAQPKNIFFGHLVSIMMYFKIVHPPAAANPLIALFADVSYDFILFPVIAGSIMMIVISFLINKLILKRQYPKKWF